MTCVALVFILCSSGYIDKERIALFPEDSEIIDFIEDIKENVKNISSAIEKNDMEQPDETETAAGTMEVHFLDVGQGDSTLIICDGEAMLIDTSTYDKGTAIQNYLQKRDIQTLDALVLTHPDADHIGSAATIVEKFEIEDLFMSYYEKDNKTYSNLLDAIEYKRYTWKTPDVGETYTLGSAEITFIAPQKEYEDPNNASIAFTVEHGENVFLFTGDAEEEAEFDMLGEKLKADVYHVGHHGSKTSSSYLFMAAVAPTYAVISCGEDNEYGHPHAQTLNTLRTMGVKVFRTDEQGGIIATSDGKNISWNMAPSETWKAGE